ncbi:HipA family kinase [uncultured Jatrophihabitans sp.]|uniref:HipA family kinase n=1 Tax=uncultured Jatrophihabitans sp. TaxID=1610747 RepID=UPI0035CA2C49
MREGGSLPGLMEADDLGTYVVKYTGAGQGRKALVAEVIAGELARGLDLPVPALVVVDVDPVLAANEPDAEVQYLLRRSAGHNLGVDYLPGALDLDIGAFAVDPVFAGRVLWFDALVGNADRSWRNPNMLFWHGAPYLIDHGATLTFQHNWANVDAAVTRVYDAADHALLGCRPEIAEVGVPSDVIESAVALVPDEWLADEPGFADVAAVRSAFVAFLTTRVAAQDDWLPALRAAVAAGPAPRRTVRPTRPEWLR